VGKQSRKKRERRDPSTLDQHRRQGKVLVPPLATLSFQLSRWSDVRLPELLWAALLLTHGPRLKVIELLRNVGQYFGEHSSDLRGQRPTISGLAKVPDVHRERILAILTQAEPARLVLSPLLLFEDLPGREYWVNVLPPPEPDAWAILAETIRKTLFHQSQEATDTQWAGVFASLSSGELQMMENVADHAKEIAFYPHLGDRRKVQPGIRSTAGALDGRGTLDRRWGDAFWKACLDNTPCSPLDEDASPTPPATGTTAERLRVVSAAVRTHALQSTVTTAPDPKHDTTFDIAMYVLALVEELLKIGNASTLMAKSALRTALEANITLAYLAGKDDLELWRSYRVFGSGQAKLVSLKIRDAVGPTPMSIDSTLVEQLANEDMWEEYLPIELEHWDKSNLREIANQANAKPNRRPRLLNPCKDDLVRPRFGWRSAFVLFGQSS